MPQKSGLSAKIGEQLESLESLPDWAIVFCIAAIVAGLTEVTSNTATTTLFLPVVANLVSVYSKLSVLYRD